ncbi:MAG: hypothetical protein MJA84_08680 [Firmicutes bacterium]|nr:hypothetical protein [Bacillota bacterium]
MIPSSKVKKYLIRIKKEQWTSEELHELIIAIARDFKIPIHIADKFDEDDFWTLSPEEERQFNDLLTKTTENLKKKQYTEYVKAQFDHEQKN